MPGPKLTEDEFRATFGNRMIEVGLDEEPPFNWIPYRSQIPEEDYEGHDCSQGIVRHVWRSDDDKYEHVLIGARDDKDVFMAIVLNRTEECVVGHRLLDLKREYGLR